MKEEVCINDKRRFVLMARGGSVDDKRRFMFVRATLHPDTSRGDRPIQGRQYLLSGLS
jgi:hypothetical protein